MKKIYKIILLNNEIASYTLVTHLRSIESNPIGKEFNSFEEAENYLYSFIEKQNFTPNYFGDLSIIQIYRI